MIELLVEKICNADTAYTLLNENYLARVSKKYFIRAKISERKCLEAHYRAKNSLGIWFDAQSYADEIEAWDFFLDFFAYELFRNDAISLVKGPVLAISDYSHRLTPIIFQYPSQLLPVILIAEFFIEVAEYQGISLKDPFWPREPKDVKRFCEATVFDSTHFLRAWRSEAGYFIGGDLD